MSEFKSYEIYTIPASGETKSIDVTLNNISEYNIIATGGGSMLLTGNEIISPTGTASEGIELTFNYNGQIIYDGGITITIFGYTLTAAEALSRYIIKCNYTNGGWKVRLIFSAGYTTAPPIDGKYIQDNTTSGVKLKDGTTNLTKLTSAASRGRVITTGVTGLYQTLDAKTSGYVLIGDGTDILSKPLSGPIAIDGNGLTSINNSSISASKLDFSIVSYLTATLTIPTADVLTLNATPIAIIANPGTGKYVEVIAATASTIFNSVAYDTNVVLQLINQGADEAQIENSLFLTTTVDKDGSKFDSIPSTAAGDTQILINTPLMVKVKTGDPLNGDSNITITVLYRVV